MNEENLKELKDANGSLDCGKKFLIGKLQSLFGKDMRILLMTSDNHASSIFPGPYLNA